MTLWRFTCKIFLTLYLYIFFRVYFLSVKSSVIFRDCEDFPGRFSREESGRRLREISNEADKFERFSSGGGNELFRSNVNVSKNRLFSLQFRRIFRETLMEACRLSWDSEKLHYKTAPEFKVNI